MTVTRNRITTLLCLVLLTAFLLAGCGCEHEWQKSTCQTPRTCRLCGETEGKVRAHEWGNTACQDPQGCIVCGTMEGIELTHEWREDCNICIHCGFDGRPADDRFPEMLAAGLEERWQIETKLQEDPEYALTRIDWEKMFDAEYDRLSSFKEDTFRDEALEEAALKYIDSIEKSKAALEYFGTEQWADKYHNSVYWDQAVALFLINDLRPVSVGEEYQETLEQILTNGEIIRMVRELLDQVMLLHIDTTNEGRTFETTLENTTSLTFKWFSLDVNLLDADGKILGTENIKVGGWAPNQKKRFSFTSKIEFAATDVAFANWELPNK